MRIGVFAAGALALATQAAVAADPSTINWSSVPSIDVNLFYPGQSSYQWVRSKDHKGAKAVARGDACVSCHDSDTEEKDLGAKLVVANALEPVPVKGKPGYKPLKVQAAYDAKNAYFRFQWPTANPFPGNEHQYVRFDGKDWKVYGYPKLDKVVQEGKQPGIYEDRMSIMIDDGKVPNFAAQGCWITCHEGSRDMPKLATKDEVAANPLLSALKRNDVRKYLPASRTNPDDWKTGKSVEDIQKLKAEGHFLDLIQWRAHRTNAVGMVDDGWVLEWRNFDAGTNPFGSNMDSATKQPKFMYDVARTGYKSITADQLRKRPVPAIIRETNAVPFDPNAGWKEGDMVPYYLVSGADAKGSAADNKGLATWKDGVWTVVMVRPLNLANNDDKALKEGGVYNVGFAVHDDNITTRGHHVSFSKTLAIGGNAKADIRAVKLP